MEWKSSGKGVWVATVARQDSNFTHRLSRAQEVFTTNGELTVVVNDEDGASHLMVFAPGVWRTVEIYLPAP